MRSAPDPVPCLVGPTGVGKTEVGIELARRLGAEVVCCDALTVYRGVRVLTAKPEPPPDVRHHLLDLVDPWDTYSAAHFSDDADRAVAQIRAAGKVPLVVGGTALYLKVWTKGLGPRVGRDAALRASLEALAAERGTQALVARLAALDPVRAAQVHPNDLRRLVRAIEIVERTGRRASDLRGEWTGADRVGVRIVGLRRTPADLHARIGARAAAMLAGGADEEVRRLDAGPRPPSRELEQAIGLADVRAWCAGRISAQECAQRMAGATRRFAKRQATFFRQFREAAWLEVAAGEPPAATAERAETALRSYAPGGTSS